jgi:uncharacterized protein YdhG (YjbR/CyaY superfamily)
VATADDPAAVDAYLARLPEAEREALERVRRAVLKVAPEARQRIGYGIVVFATEFDLVGIASQAKHLSFYTMSPPLVRELGDELARFEVSGGTIHFTPERTLPVKLIEKIVRARVRANRERRTAR